MSLSAHVGGAGDERDEQEVGGRATDAADAATDADEPVTRTAHRTYQQQRHLRQRTKNIPVSRPMLAAVTGCVITI